MPTQSLRSLYRSIYDFNYYNRDCWVAAWAAQIPADALVLDVGAGMGKYRKLFAHCRYRAQDFAQESGTIGKYTHLQYVSDITAIPLEEGTVDVILCTEVLEHVPEPIVAIQEFARLLKPGGLLLVTAPLGSFLHQEPFHFYGGYTPHWYRRFLTGAGFEVREIAANQGFFSWFGQEAMRFAETLSPGNTRTLSLLQRCGVTLLWLFSMPFARLMPLVARWLDRLSLESSATVGYHVSAVRDASLAGAPARK